MINLHDPKTWPQEAQEAIGLYICNIFKNMNKQLEILRRNTDRIRKEIKTLKDKDVT